MPTPRPHAPVTIAELTAGLIWPKLLRAFALSVQPGRLVIGIAGALVIWGAIHFLDPVFGAPIDHILDGDRHFPHGIDGVMPLGGFFYFLAGRFYDPGVVSLASRWYTVLPFFAILLSLLALFSGAIARSAAADVAADLSMSVKETIRFALQRWKGLIFAVLIPLILMALLCAVITPFAWLMAPPEGSEAARIAFSAIPLLLGFMLAVVSLATIAGHSMLAPAVVIESTDAADAIQRVYAYLVGRFGRVALYLGLIIVLGVLAEAVIHFAIVLAIAWTEALTNTSRLGSAWAPVLGVFLWGWLISYYSCSGSLLYLLMRRVNDEQDIREIWMPGMVPGTLAPIVEGEAEDDED